MCSALRDSIYRVWIEEGPRYAMGTAFAIKAPDLVATASHVVNGKSLNKARLMSPLFQQRSFRFRKVAEDKEADLAILQLRDPDPGFSPLRISSTITAPGQPVWAMGYPRTYFGRQQFQSEKYMRRLAVSPCAVAPSPIGAIDDFLFVRPKLYPGMSGSPILDEANEVVGVLVMIVNRERGPRWLDTDLTVCVSSLRLAQLLVTSESRSRRSSFFHWW